MRERSASFASLLANRYSSVLVGLRRIGGARALWVNEHAEALDPNYQKGMPSDIYRARLTAACAVMVSDRGRPDVYGWADRYGGSGIGPHGGSGRSVLVNGYSVKGVGPTPLLGYGEGLAHTSGGAYLEESIREVLFSRLLRGVLPHGASPILAIIDTGVDQTWHGEDTIMTERRVLIVRPFSLRPAHFQRAYRYCPKELSEKRSDIKRVSHNFAIFSEALGAEFLRMQLERAYTNWAQQVAYATVHNLLLGLSPSNIDIDGAVIDFGGASTLTEPANYVSSPGNVLFSEFNKVTDAVDDLADSLMGIHHPAFMEMRISLQRVIVAAFEKTLIAEILASVGLRGHLPCIVDDAIACEEIIRGFLAYHRQTMRLRVDLIPRRYKVTHPPVPALGSIWSAEAASSLQPLAAVLHRRFPSSSFKRSSGSVMPWGVTRETVRENIHEYLAESGPIADLTAMISHFESRWM